MAAADVLSVQVLILDSDAAQVEQTVRSALEGRGHRVESALVVTLAGLRAALNGSIQRGGLVLLCGGSRAEGRRALALFEAQLEEPLPGFLEVLRLAAWQVLGPAAMGVQGAAGFTVEGTPAVAVPGPAGAVHLALEQVILPGMAALRPLGALGWPAPGEAPPVGAVQPAPAQAAAAAPAGAAPSEPEPQPRIVGVGVGLGASLTPSPAPPPVSPAQAAPLAPEAVEESEEHEEEPNIQALWGLSKPAPCDMGVGKVGQGWRAAVRAFRADIDKKEHPFLPDAFQGMVKARELLGTAGEKGVMTLPDGRRFGVFGWPDLRSPTGKVIAVGQGDPIPEVIALHHFPEQVGTCVFGGGGMLPGADLLPDPLSEERTGFPLKEWGQLFALGRHFVYVQRGDKIISWNGMRERELGSPGNALGELIAEWAGL